MHAYLANDRKLTECLRVGIARDVAHALVPDIAAAVLPSVLDKYRVDGRPAHLRVPEPQSSLWGRLLRPSLDMWFIPARERSPLVFIARKAANAVWTIGNDAVWAWPLAVKMLCAIEVNGGILAPENVALLRLAPVCVQSSREQAARQILRAFGLSLLEWHAFSTSPAHRATKVANQAIRTNRRREGPAARLEIAIASSAARRLCPSSADRALAFWLSTAGWCSFPAILRGRSEPSGSAVSAASVGGLAEWFAGGGRGEMGPGVARSGRRRGAAPSDSVTSALRLRKRAITGLGADDRSTPQHAIGRRCRQRRRPCKAHAHAPQQHVEEEPQCRRPKPRETKSAACCWPAAGRGGTC